MFIESKTIQGPRDYQQDACWGEDNLIVLADGMGGHANGDLAAQSIISYIQATDKTNQDILNAIEAANLSCLKARDGRGSTVVCALVEEQAINIHWSGDSRAYAIRADGLQQLTKDHGHGHILYTCVGLRNMHVESRTLDREGILGILLTSDGIHDYIDMKSLNLEPLSLLDSIFARTEPATQDNATAILLWL